VTALENRDDYQHHWRRLLANTSLAGISWMNLRLDEIRLEQLKSFKTPSRSISRLGLKSCILHHFTSIPTPNPELQ
jgi:hypothetical protein